MERLNASVDAKNAKRKYQGRKEGEKVSFFFSLCALCVNAGVQHPSPVATLEVSEASIHFKGFAEGHIRNQRKGHAHIGTVPGNLDMPVVAYDTEGAN